MVASTPQRVAIVGVVAALAMAAIQILERQHCARRLRQRTVGRLPRLGGRHRAPEAPQRHGQRHPGSAEHATEQERQGVVREHSVEISGQPPRQQSAVDLQGQQQEQRQR
ncbi:hypothetical protein D3C76_621500 [compost metagenome]